MNYNTKLCTDCPGPPQNQRISSPLPPNVTLLWDRPSTPDMWSILYHVEWQNGTSAVEDTADTQTILSAETQAILPNLEAVTEYTVTITAFTYSTLCAGQSVNFSFNTTQSESIISSQQ